MNSNSNTLPPTKKHQSAKVALSREFHQESLTCKQESLERGEINFVSAAGLKLRYLKRGTGQPIVLMHTLRTQLEYFENLIPELAKHYTVYALDLPGHGQSQIIERPHTKGFFIKHMSAFINALELEHVTLLGESVGASIALGIAAKNCKNTFKIQQIFALNPADYQNSNGIDRSSPLGKVLFSAINWPLLGWFIANAETKFVLKKVLEGGFEDKANLPSKLVNVFSRTGSRAGYSKAFRSIFLHWHTWTADQKNYPNIKAPVTFIYSSHDWATQAERIVNHQKIANSQLITLQNTGHFSALDNPDGVLSQVLSHAQNYVPEVISTAVKNKAINSTEITSTESSST